MNGPAESPLFTAAPQGTAVAPDVSPSVVPTKTLNSPSELARPANVVTTTDVIGVPSGTSTESHGESSWLVTEPVSKSESIALEAAYWPLNLKVELWAAETGVTREPAAYGAYGRDGGEAGMIIREPRRLPGIGCAVGQPHRALQAPAARPC